jgi:EpsI family protein
MQLSRTLIVAAILLCTSAALGYFHQSQDVLPKKPLNEFPMAIGPWQGTVDRFEARIYDVLGVDDSTLGNFKDHAGNVVQLYIGYHSSQREGDLIHSPKNCMPGSGWNIVETSLVDLNVPSREQQPVRVIRLLLQKGAQKQMALYWYHSRGRVIASEYLQKIYLVMDSITRRRTDGSFIRLTAPVMVDEGQTLETLKGFAVRLFPIIDEFLPS